MLKISFKFLLMLMMTFSIVSSCQKSGDDFSEKTEEEQQQEEEEVITPELTLEKEELKFSSAAAGSLSVKITTNIDNLEATSTADWCEAKISDKELVVTVMINEDQFNDRTAEITIVGDDKSTKLVVIQPKAEFEAGNLDELTDTKLTVIAATATSVQSTNLAVEKMFDGDYDSFYCSKFGNDLAAPHTVPFDLTFELESPSNVDYIIYYPKPAGASSRSGDFGEVDIYAEVDGTEALIKSVDCKIQPAASKITLDEPLKGVKNFRFHVKSGDSDKASCAEMEFYSKNPNTFDPLTLFTDTSCSELKADITDEQIEACGSEFYKNIAKFIKSASPEQKEFRIDSFKAWLDPKIQSKELKVRQANLLDNPTGIVATEGEELIILVGETNDQPLSIKIQNLDDPEIDGYYDLSSFYTLTEGTNRITPKNDGLIYVLYHSETPELCEPIKIHFTSGYVNGYFDSQKHDDSKWMELLNRTEYSFMDLVGKYTHLTFPVESFRKFTKEDGPKLIDQYDELMYLQQEFMGLVKYNKMYKNRMYYQYAPKGSPFASTNRTVYPKSTMDDRCTLDRFIKDPWGPAHETGHMTQTGTTMKWQGMTEVTNNIQSMNILTTWGNLSRLEDPNRNKSYETAHTELAEVKLLCRMDTWHKLVPFWQLQLYFGKAKGNADFYKDIYEEVRLSPDPDKYGPAQIEFVKVACHSAKADLTDFFTYWGFLSPVDELVSDYGGDKAYLVTQEMIDEVKAWIKAQEYPAPADFTQIKDSTWESYK